MSTGAKGRQAEMQSQDILHLVTQQLQWHTNISPDQVRCLLIVAYETRQLCKDTFASANYQQDASMMYLMRRLCLWLLPLMLLIG